MKRISVHEMIGARKPKMIRASEGKICHINKWINGVLSKVRIVAQNENRNDWVRRSMRYGVDFDHLSKDCAPIIPVLKEGQLRPKDTRRPDQ